MRALLRRVWEPDGGARGRNSVSCVSVGGRKRPASKLLFTRVLCPGQKKKVGSRRKRKRVWHALARCGVRHTQANSATEKSHVCSNSETASPRYALLYPELPTLPQRPSEKRGMSVCKNLGQVSLFSISYDSCSVYLTRLQHLRSGVPRCRVAACDLVHSGRRHSNAERKPTDPRRLPR